jgi:Pilus assembly protein, PilO
MATFKKTLEFTTKQTLVDKDNTFILFLLATTSAVTIFCLVSANSLYAKMNYQNKVIGIKNNAANQLDSNYNASQNLTSSYQKFQAQSVPVKGVQSNAVMVLDALPSKYDFPALFTSLSARMLSDKLIEKNLTATDNQVNALQSSPDPKLVAMPFSISGEGSIMSIESYISDLENSIRPMVISNIVIDIGQTTGSSQSIPKLDIKATTYYQPEKTFKIVNKTVTANGVLQ